ncbi:HET-domain-containing protein [Tothia fuscella]|uniref:HET-domain-containing protein n=1 Tax=Tothia fuscella TaxID=1048955 RepID=A0A9P4NS84_9PEZI|nr:HET-domain-containing protein [Tothia fuscella]
MRFEVSKICPGFQFCFDLARTWLKTCSELHLRCTQATGGTLPTRLLELTCENVRLRLSSELSESEPKYATLSYCWGDQGNMRTTMNSLSVLRQDITPSALPQVILDAIFVTWELGLRYLWMDSLCIIQDSPEDWKVECQRMADYYGNSYVTISVLDSPDVNRGFLQVKRHKVESPMSNNRGKCLRLAPPEGSEVFKNSALNLRAWALQERLLATRVLHYADSELFWECHTCRAREGSARSNSYPYGDHLKLLLSNRYRHGVSEGDTFFEVWYRIIKHYSQRSLSFLSDKLPAISGVAAMLQEKSGFHYISGLWEEDVFGLTWLRAGPWEESPRVLPDVRSGLDRTQSIHFIEGSPTWSWAHVDAPVDYLRHYTRDVTTHNDLEIMQAESPAEGLLTVKALFKRLWVKKNESRFSSTECSHWNKFPYDASDNDGKLAMRRCRTLQSKAKWKGKTYRCMLPVTPVVGEEGEMVNLLQFSAATAAFVSREAVKGTTPGLEIP